MHSIHDSGVHCRGPMAFEHLLDVRNLVTEFHTDAGVVRAVDGVSYYINENEIVGTVGESGCGKSVTQLSVLQLIASPPGEIVSGKVIFEGRNLLDYSPKGEEMYSVRGGKIAMIFQEPMTSLNPVLTISQQLTEMLELHLDQSSSAARMRAIELLRLVGIPAAQKRIDDYPYQFSGGMRQRVMIAMALSCNPKVIIADEPTTAVDVTIQAQILDLMRELRDTLGTAIILITHDMGVVAENADRVVVMYAGRKVEEANVDDLFERPAHPYTRGLLGSI